MDTFLVTGSIALAIVLSLCVTGFILYKCDARPEKRVPSTTYHPADVTISTVHEERMPTDMGEKHSRLWVQFLHEACTDLEDRLRVDMPAEEAQELYRQLFDKRRQIAIHTAMYPSSSRDAEYMQEHVNAAKGVK